MKSKFVPVFCFLFLVVIVSSYYLFSKVSRDQSRPAPIKDTETKVNYIVEDDASSPQQFDGDIQSEAYLFGFKRGKDAFLIQTNNPDAPPSTTKEEYAVLIEDKYSDEEKELYKDAMLKGYIDGYHKTSEGFHCPRRE